MPIEVKIHDTNTLLGVMTEMEPPSSYWLDLCFGSQMTFEDEYIDFEKLTKMRKLAPFVAPSAQGRPIYSQGSTVTRLKPAYIKPKDTVNPFRQVRRRPGELLSRSPASPGARFNAVLADILREHREAIERRWEWLAAQAVINGSVTIADEDYPERVVNFGRASNHTITLSGGGVWSSSSDIIGDLNAWRARVRAASFGGVTNRLTVGGDAWAVMQSNAGIKAQLDTQYRGTNASLNTGLREGLEVEYVGRIGTLDIYVYSDYYQDNSGAAVPFLDSKSVVLTGPNVQGVRAFGAILDKAAGLRALPIFPKQWDQEDPSATYVMSQSAPLMVPVNPNNTLKAKVLE